MLSEEEERKKWEDAAMKWKERRRRRNYERSDTAGGCIWTDPSVPKCCGTRGIGGIGLSAVRTEYDTVCRRVLLLLRYDGDDDGDTVGMNAKIRRMWNDKFLCLSGPELLRMDVAIVGSHVDDVVAVGSGAAKEVEPADVDVQNSNN